jgi:putative intracellular protease/amidase
MAATIPDYYLESTMKTVGRLLLLLCVFCLISPANAKNILVVMSGADHLDLQHGGVHQTGIYLNELMQPVILLQDAGHTLTFATPDGRIPTIDPHSISTRNFAGNQAALEQAQQRLATLQLLSATSSPVISLARVEQIGAAHFDAVFIPGGHAPMQDLATDPALGRILRTFHQHGKPTALVCHGPVALLSTLPQATAFTRALAAHQPTARQDWIYSGYRLTVLSNRIEESMRPLFKGDEMKFYPQDALVAAGARFSEARDPASSYVIIDRELITGENPASASAVAKALLHKLGQ